MHCALNVTFTATGHRVTPLARSVVNNCCHVIVCVTIFRKKQNCLKVILTERFNKWFASSWVKKQANLVTWSKMESAVGTCSYMISDTLAPGNIFFHITCINCSLLSQSTYSPAAVSISKIVPNKSTVFSFLLFAIIYPCLKFYPILLSPSYPLFMQRELSVRYADTSFDILWLWSTFCVSAVYRLKLHSFCMSVFMHFVTCS